MSDATSISQDFDAPPCRTDGHIESARQLLALVYDELRRLASSQLRHERPGQTLQATALVHEAYLRLVDVQQPQSWQSRSHFFAAAAEAMRRILIEQARRKKSLKAGGEWSRVELASVESSVLTNSDEILALDEALEKLAFENPEAAELARLRIFAGLTLDEAALALGLAKTTAFRRWTYARAYLQLALQVSVE